MKLRLNVKTEKQLREAQVLISDENIEYIYAPYHILTVDISDALKEKIIITFPLFTERDDDFYKEKLNELIDKKYSRLYCSSMNHIGLAENFQGIKLHGGAKLNITNSDSVAFYESLGLIDTELSMELKTSQIEKITSNIPLGIYAYGNLPLMTLKRCPLSDDKPCKNSNKSCKKIITDRKDKVWKVFCGSESEVVELMNPDPLILSDKLCEFKNLDFLTLYFTYESEIKSTVNMYLNGTNSGAHLTRGLYFRGVE